MKVERNAVVGGGILVILTSKYGHRQTFIKANDKNEFEKIVTLIVPEETHGVMWETKEF